MPPDLPPRMLEAALATYGFPGALIIIMIWNHLRRVVPADPAKGVLDALEDIKADLKEVKTDVKGFETRITRVETRQEMLMKGDG